MTTMRRRYSQLALLDTFEDRFEYLRLNGEVGRSTFGFDRYLNQTFYQSYEWRQVRTHVIARDSGCDLGILDRPINGGLVVHHINPMKIEDVVAKEEWILNPEYLICTSSDTHNAIHYGDASLLRRDFTPRRPGDTKLW